MLERVFRLKEHGSRPRTEVLAGTTTFLTMAYIVFVNPITAGALIFVGFLMMHAIRNIEWDDWGEAFPAFLTIVTIPLTYSISNGIGLGFISHTLIKVFRGQARQVRGLMLAVSCAFVIAFILQAH